MDKAMLIDALKKKVLDILPLYDSNQVKIDINCDVRKGIVKVNITEIYN